MLRLTTLQGHATDPSVARRLAHAAEHGGLETLRLSGTDIARKRLLARTDRGTEVALMLDRDAVLTDGSVLLLDHDRAIVVRLDEALWLTVHAPDAARALALGYFAGSLHWKVRFDGTTLLVAIEMPRENYLARLAPLLDSGAATLGPDVRSSQPAVAAPAHGHGRGHDHEAEHAHDHGHGHEHPHDHDHAGGGDAGDGHRHAHVHPHVHVPAGTDRHAAPAHVAHPVGGAHR